ncbi:MAG: hypothetical protein WCS94_08325 [Verrucomicrobiota bacterium]
MSQESAFLSDSNSTYDPAAADVNSLFGSWDPNTTSGNVTNPSIANASTGGIIAANNTTGSSGGLGNFFGGLLDFATKGATIYSQVASAQKTNNQNTGVAGPGLVRTTPTNMAAWLPYAIGGAVLLVLAVVFLKKK